MTITDDRRGERDLLGRMKVLRGMEARAGVLQPDPTREGDTTIAAVAAAHEFGTRRIPQRSFIGRTLDGEADKLAEVQERALAKVLDGSMSPEQATEVVGLAAASAIRETIRSSVPPPLKAATVKAKGTDRTLVDTGQLLNSIKHEVAPATREAPGG